MTLVDVFTSLADKIRSILGTTDKYSPISAIEAIDDVYDKGVADGTTPTQAKTITAGTSAVTVNPDSGYALSSVTVNPTPSQSKSATPSTSAQTISPDSGKLLSSVSISAISTETKTQAAGTSNVDVTPTSGKYLTKVTVTPTPTQEKTITASRSAQTVTPDSGKHLSKVTVNKYPDATGTYTYPANSTGGTYDMGTTNNLRYVNASNVYAKGKADGAKSFKSTTLSANVWSVTVPANTISVIVCSTPFSPDITLGSYTGCTLLYNNKTQSGTYNSITDYTYTVVVKVDGSNRTVTFNHGATGYCTMSVTSII